MNARPTRRRQRTLIIRPSAIDRLAAKYIPEPMSGCWIWTAGVCGSGYGSFRGQLAHRVAYRLMVGPIPDGLLIRHQCDNPLCVNPDHLIPGTHADNMGDMRKRGRQRASLDSIKLSAEKVRAIRSDARPQRTIAHDYGVCQTTVSEVKRREAWAGVK